MFEMRVWIFCSNAAVRCSGGKGRFLNPTIPDATHCASVKPSASSRPDPVPIAAFPHRLVLLFDLSTRQAFHCTHLVRRENPAPLHAVADRCVTARIIPAIDDA